MPRVSLLGCSHQRTGCDLLAHWRLSQGSPCMPSARTRPRLVKAPVHQVCANVDRGRPHHHAALHELALRGTCAPLVLLLLLHRLLLLHGMLLLLLLTVNWLQGLHEL